MADGGDAEAALRHAHACAVGRGRGGGHRPSRRIRHGWARQRAGLGGRASLYTRFVLEELVPYVQTQYHLLRGAHNRAIMGASLGGLSAFDIGWRHPEHFGTIGVFSGSFWWRSDDSSLAAKVSSRIAHALVRERRRHTKLRFWFEAGLYDETADRDGDGVIDAIQDTIELIDELVRGGYERGADLVYREVAGDHSPATWAEYLPEFLTWAFGPTKSTG
ncbi:esterase family protein [Candidatus Gracilibacteria bacterium]|nr:esterase family protein [Candidatus Gracilibacteria bacterium]